MRTMSFPSLTGRLLVFGIATLLIVGTAYANSHEAHTSTVFSGKAVNGGTVTHVREGGKSILRLSDDFVIPGSPDPHWQVIDSKGEVHLLQALKLKEGLSNREIVLPRYVPNVAKVQIWCAFAQVLLGEASFERPVK
jgi:hypothetical protein